MMFKLVIFEEILGLGSCASSFVGGAIGTQRHCPSVLVIQTRKGPHDLIGKNRGGGDKNR